LRIRYPTQNSHLVQAGPQAGSGDAATQGAAMFVPGELPPKLDTPDDHAMGVLVAGLAATALEPRVLPLFPHLREKD